MENGLIFVTYSEMSRDFAENVDQRRENELERWEDKEIGQWPPI